MSDDERDIDVELDDGDLGAIDDGDCGSIDGMPENKRALHNAMERKRRDSIKDSFRGLQECIPTLKGDKTSRAQVLKKTGDYIAHMQKKINGHTDEIKELKNQNAHLETQVQIRQLEKAKATGNFGASDIEVEESLVTGSELELDRIEGAEIVYDDTSSDTSDFQPLQQVHTLSSSKSVVIPVQGQVIKSLQQPRMTVSLPSVQGVAVSLPSGSLSSGQTVTVVAPGKSLLSTNALRVQPGQSLLLSEPLRKKMKF